eukprot:2147188-Amphidinium_carterae.1
MQIVGKVGWKSLWALTVLCACPVCSPMEDVYTFSPRIKESTMSSALPKSSRTAVGVVMLLSFTPVCNSTLVLDSEIG